MTFRGIGSIRQCLQWSTPINAGSIGGGGGRGMHTEEWVEFEYFGEFEDKLENHYDIILQTTCVILILKQNRWKISQIH